MKTTKLSELPIVPESYETAHYEKLDYTNVFSQMSPVERKFINGLLRYYQPEHILEIGVSQGGGTVNILNAISDIPNASLCSVDVTTSDLCGIEAKLKFPNIPESKWQLITGKDISEIASKALEKGKIDFVILDSMHLHPVESLNFLSVLPFLNEGAIVVLHDISVFAFPKENGTNLASRILYSSIVGDKLSPDYGDELHENSCPGVVNIAAFQILPDTRKYIGNVFDGLLHPWEYFPHQYLNTVRELFTEHYSQENIIKFDKAREQNATWMLSGKSTFSRERLSLLLFEKFAVPVIFYGAGYNMRVLLSAMKELNLDFNADIWDINAKKIDNICGYKVLEPDFTSPVQNCNVIVMIQDSAVFQEVKGKFELLGYTVYHEFDQYMKYGE